MGILGLLFGVIVEAVAPVADGESGTVGGALAEGEAAGGALAAASAVAVGSTGAGFSGIGKSCAG